MKICSYSTEMARVLSDTTVLVRRLYLDVATCLLLRQSILCRGQSEA